MTKYAPMRRALKTETIVSIFYDLRMMTIAVVIIPNRGTMSERDFYFGKLQEVERVCQELGQRKDNHPETELVLAQIKQVL